MKTAVCPGSFDPITNGHIDIIKRASKLFDKVIILVSPNPDKHCMFTPGERVDMIRRVTSDMKNTEVRVLDGLLAEYLKTLNDAVIVKGLRAVTDFEYEFQMSLTNRKLNPEAETVFLTTDADLMYLSSSIVKQIASFNGDISNFVPLEIRDDIIKRVRLMNCE